MDAKEDAYMLNATDDSQGEAHPSAYTAPVHLRLQAEPGHSSNSRPQKRGNLTADNLERIPEADQVAPGIRLETAGNDYDMEEQDERRQRRASAQRQDQRDDEEREGLGRRQRAAAAEDRELTLEHAREEFVPPPPPPPPRAPSSMDMSGRSSTGAMDNEGSEPYQDADMASDDGKSAEMVHERVGGSGATSENASKGTSVGHFGPRGEPVPGVPPHLDPRQPHFRPPSPSAASVFSVAVQPPASPKLQAAAGHSTGTVRSSLGEVVDSGDETESFDNGALTPTLSDEFANDDDVEDRMKLPSGAGASFNVNRMNVDLDDNQAALSSSGPYQVSFSPVVTSHHRGSISNYSGRAPSVAATAGSSRAPSTRGLSPPAPTSHAGTTEGSEFESTGTGLEGETGAETPSVGRSRRSSYSAPSSEQDGGSGFAGGVAGVGIGGAVEDVNNRARGGTLVPGSQTLASHSGVGQGFSTTASSTYADAGEDEGPSLAPSEAGSDSIRSMTYESSTGHGAPTLGLGPATTSSERIHASAAWSASAPFGQSGFTDGEFGLAGQTSHPFKSSLSSNTPMLPSLLAIKRSSRRQGPPSTTATAGTTSPPSSVSVDGDFDDPAYDAPPSSTLEVPPSA